MALCLTACVDDEYSGDDTPLGEGTVSFVNTVAPFTRAGKTGKEAADALGGKFYVYGIKNETTVGPGILTSDNLVFQNYKVTYTDGSANSSTSNSTGWEYVGNTLTTGEAANMDNSGAATQTIKYWDYNASSYTFYAFAVANDDLENGNIKVSKVTDYALDAYRNGYTVDVTADADPTKLYLSKRVEIMSSANKDHTQVNKYGGRVNMAPELSRRAGANRGRQAPLSAQPITWSAPSPFPATGGEKQGGTAPSGVPRSERADGFFCTSNMQGGIRT